MIITHEEVMRQNAIFQQYIARFGNPYSLQSLLSLEVRITGEWINLLEIALSSGVAVTPEDLAREFPGMQPFRVDGPVVGCV